METERNRKGVLKELNKFAEAGGLEELSRAVSPRLMGDPNPWHTGHLLSLAIHLDVVLAG